MNRTVSDPGGKSGIALREVSREVVPSLRDVGAERYRDMAARASVQIDNLQERVDRVAGLGLVESAGELVASTVAERTSSHV